MTAGEPFEKKNTHTKESRWVNSANLRRLRNVGQHWISTLVGHPRCVNIIIILVYLSAMNQKHSLVFDVYSNASCSGQMVPSADGVFGRSLRMKQLWLQENYVAFGV